MKTLILPDISNQIPEKMLSDIMVADAEFPFIISPYYLDLIDFDNLKNDPVFKQAFPDICELRNHTFADPDPLNEEEQMPVKNLIHRYHDRAVLLVTNRCAVHCRFCLRKRKWKQGVAPQQISEDELDNVCRYLQQHQEIKEVLISGGDPLTLKTCELRKILLRISQISSVEILRLGTRIPVVMPSRIDQDLVKMLAEFPGLWVATHFNHPVELTADALAASSQLVRAGIPMVNQTVLLKGINDDSEILAELFSSLAKNKIKPHYLFHIDPVKGNAHFATGIEAGLQIMRELRNKISSLCTPVFAIDLPEGGGKVPLQPNYLTPEGYEAIDGSKISYP